MASRLWARTVLAVLIPVLAGCGLGAGSPERSVPVDPAMRDVTAEKGPPPLPPPTARQGFAKGEAGPEAGSDGTTVLSPPPRPHRKPALVQVAPAELNGLEIQDAWRLFGQPDAQQAEPPATVWSYRRGACRLRLYFYPDLLDNRKRALTYELEPGSRHAGARRSCLIILANRDRHGEQTAETPDPRSGP